MIGLYAVNPEYCCAAGEYGPENVLTLYAATAPDARLDDFVGLAQLLWEASDRLTGVTYAV